MCGKGWLDQQLEHNVGMILPHVLTSSSCEQDRARRLRSLMCTVIMRTFRRIGPKSRLLSTISTHDLFGLLRPTRKISTTRTR